MAVTPLGDLAPESRSNVEDMAESIKEFLKMRFEVDRMNMTDKEMDEFALLLGRRALVVSVYDSIRQQTSKMSAMAPSVVRQAMEMRLYRKEANDSGDRNTP